VNNDIGGAPDERLDRRYGDPLQDSPVQRGVRSPGSRVDVPPKAPLSRQLPHHAVDRLDTQSDHLVKLRRRCGRFRPLRSATAMGSLRAVPVERFVERHTG
jgi:hypothetical protein